MCRAKTASEKPTTNPCSSEDVFGLLLERRNGRGRSFVPGGKGRLWSENGLITARSEVGTSPFPVVLGGLRENPVQGRECESRVHSNGTRDLDLVAETRAVPDTYTGPKRGLWASNGEKTVSEPSSRIALRSSWDYGHMV
ncbi:hypothetical protein TNCV_3509441 [Trichonephila clavipes]|nr:hypothetical protein TNCV_3509441 [Trichonephila clavipes]